MMKELLLNSYKNSTKNSYYMIYYN